MNLSSSSRIMCDLVKFDLQVMLGRPCTYYPIN